MKQRGRPSAASLTMVPRSVGEIMERLPPPRDLLDEQAEVWAAIVSGHPADWFAAGSTPLLAQLCRHVVVGKRLAELIESDTDLDDWLVLLREQRHESDAIRKLSMALRLAPQSLINHHGNKNQAPAVNRPWADPG